MGNEKFNVYNIHHIHNAKSIITKVFTATNLPPNILSNIHKIGHDKNHHAS
ncbi:MAG: hypothetical protein WCG25_09205 [bacterium]